MLVQVAVLDPVSASPVEVADSAVIPGGPAYALGGQRQVRSLLGQPCLCFCVCAACLVTDKAVYIFFHREIIRSVIPAVTGVTGGAAGPVGLDPNTEIVYQVALPDGHRPGASL